MKWKRLTRASIVVLLPAALLLTCCSRCFAWGIVFDPQAYAQSLTNYMNQVRQYAQQCQQYSMQIRQYAAQVQNLQNFDYVIDLSGFREMQNIVNSAKGIASDYKRLQSQFDQVYPEFSKFSTMSGKDFASKASEWLQQTADTNRDALDLVSRTKDWFNSDSNDLTNLTIKANNVAGARDGLQSIAQISALQSKQLLQLQQTMSASAKTEGAYMAQRASEEAAALERQEKLFGNPDIQLKKMKGSQSKPKKPWWNR